jgi:hypothetical protein
LTALTRFVEPRAERAKDATKDHSAHHDVMEMSDYEVGMVDINIGNEYG